MRASAAGVAGPARNTAIGTLSARFQGGPISQPIRVAQARLGGRLTRLKCLSGSRRNRPDPMPVDGGSSLQQSRVGI